MAISGQPARKLGVALGLLAALALGFLWGQRKPSEQQPAVAPGMQLASTATVLLAVRELSRLESVAFHMERIIDLKQRQRRLFGMLEAEDAILLVAVGEVVAGVDLAKLRDGDVTIDPAARRVVLRLPEPEILWARLDNEQTYVHSRDTDLLARRSDEIESEARRYAERSIREAALAAGILQQARQRTEQTLSALVRSLGYEEVIFPSPKR